VSAGAPLPTDPRRDRRLLQAAGGLRAVGTSLAGVLLGLYLAELGHDATAIGVVSTAGLAGAATAAVLAARRGDLWGRRRTLLGVAAVAAVACAAFLAASSLAPLALLAFLGMLNAMGRDRGAAATLEQAALPSTVPPERRTFAFAGYTALQDAGHAVGSLAAGLAGALASFAGLSTLAAMRATMALHPALLVATLPLYLRLSPAIEPVSRSTPVALSAASRRIVVRICALFAVDGLGGGFLVGSLLSFFFFERFGASASTVAVLFFAARLANLASHFAAAWLATRIGLVNTMVFTHVPSSLLLVAVAFADDFATAAALFLAREALVEMDVPTRQSYVVAIVGPEERTAAAGAANVVRLAAWAVAPLVAGVAMARLSLAAPLVIGAAIKIAYDLLLWLAFRRVRPPEESARA
jgi:MFS family permease